ncbi:glycosyltransferase family 2 protein [Rugosibacter aromaticivorans]|uniref:glycosyltransferase family 2 protein n=1 Tax=Rugosibacter aromaticivorans TaxID=1565605 RepID=UPI000A81C696|nr:glycosyltransferase family 2 protein [Rugosibacter aromaticivorans]
MIKTPVSAVLVTKNAAHTLPACLASVAFCDEILVVDSGSTDDTAAIALKYGARVIHSHWRGFGPQKQFAVGEAAHDWVLCIDADERVSDHLRQSLQAVLNDKTIATPAVSPTPVRCLPCTTFRSPPGTFYAYRFARCNRFMGHYLRHGEGYPDWSLRFFNRHHAQWSADVVHEKVCATGAVGTLAGDLLHDSAESLANYLDKQNHYSTLAANAARAQGKRAHAAHLLLSPLVRFIKFYFFRRGFLDGLPGLTHILIGCGTSFVKYAKMAALQRQPPDLTHPTRPPGTHS